MPPVPVVRVEGLRPDGNVSITPEALVVAGRLQRDSKSARTRKAEAALGLGDVLYFYVGWANPDFGDMVFAYHPEMTQGHTGSATYFDTGAFHRGAIHRTDNSTSHDYLELHRMELPGWQPAFDAYVSEYFASASAYMTGQRPTTDDPSGRLLHANNGRWAWTWELQLLEDHDLGASLLQAFFAREVHQKFQSLYENAQEQADRQMAAVLVKTSEEVDASDGFGACQRAEEVMATWV